MKLIINITKGKMFLIMLVLILVSFAIAEITEPELVFTDKEKEIIDELIAEPLAVKHPTNTTEEELNIIKNHYRIDEVIIQCVPNNLCDGINNCCNKHCHYLCITNYRDTFNMMRNYEGETEASFKEELEKRIIDNEIQHINYVSEAPFFWRGIEAKTLGVK